MTKSKFPQPLSGRKFTGILREPIERVNQLALGLETYGLPDEVRAEISRLAASYDAKKVSERIEALAQHYDVDITSKTWELELVLRLAEDFVVGFNDQKTTGPVKSGRPKGAKNKDNNRPRDDFPLFIEIKKLTEGAKGLTLSQACDKLRKQRGKSWSGLQITGVEERYWNFESELQRAKEAAASDPFWGQIAELVSKSTDRK